MHGAVSCTDGIIDGINTVGHLNRSLCKLGLEAHPFNISWYNDLRRATCPETPQFIESADPNATGIVVISNPEFFREVVARFDPDGPSPHFVNRAVDEVLATVLATFPSRMEATGRNTDRPPYVHVQSIGHVAGMDEYVPGDSLPPPSSSEAIAHRDPELWGSTASRILGVSIHPRYGGWYAYRMLIVLHGVSWPPHVPRPSPLSFLSTEEKATIIYEYNKNPDLGKWRDFNDKQLPMERYDTAQFEFFHERSNDKRRSILKRLANEYKVEGNGKVS